MTKLSGPSIAVSLVGLAAVSLVGLAAGLHGLGVARGNGDLAAVTPAVVRVAMASSDTAALDHIPIDLVRGDSIRLYAAFLFDDSIIGCTGWDRSQPETMEPCDRAAALLIAAHPEYFPQDTILRYIRFRWAPKFGSNIAPFTSLDYNITVFDSVGALVLDTTVAHPDSALEWLGGTEEASYTATVAQVGLFQGDTMRALPSTRIAFTFPSALPVLLQLDPLTVDTIQQ